MKKLNNVKKIKTGDFKNVELYRSADGKINLSVSIENDTVWLDQVQISELFQKAKSTINEHILNILNSKELSEDKCVRKIGNSDFSHLVTKKTNYYNLDMILAIGYRVNSENGIKFRNWATDKLKQYIVKGFAIDDEKLKLGGERARYFKELLQRVRDIRSSERNFYQQVTDIYATSIDYKNDDDSTREFFATVQNKMHFAVHAHTAAEIIFSRVNSKKENIGLTNFKGKYITKDDVKIAKNYLNEAELIQLNLIVSLYLDFAELQASNQIPMKMFEWIQKLDDFLKLSGKKLLNHAGKISKIVAEKKAMEEFEIYKKEYMQNLVSDFDIEVKKVNKK